MQVCLSYERQLFYSRAAGKLCKRSRAMHNNKSCCGAENLVKLEQVLGLVNKLDLAKDKFPPVKPFEGSLVGANTIELLGVGMHLYVAYRSPFSG